MSFSDRFFQFETIFPKIKITLIKDKPLQFTFKRVQTPSNLNNPIPMIIQNDWLFSSLTNT